MNKLVEDLAILTTAPQSALTALVDRSVLCISHDVFESIQSGSSVTEIDIGIGILYIKYEEDKIKYKFIPSKKLEEEVLNTIMTNSSPLQTCIEEALKVRIENTYKDFL